MPKNYTVKLKGSEQTVYTSAVIAYRNIILERNVDDSIASRLLDKAEDSKLKLSELEHKHLLKAVQIYRNTLIEKGNDTSVSDSLLKRLLEVKTLSRER